eukprot:Nk52_evm26s96 gene=Nk52_evmTU26s96
MYRPSPDNRSSYGNYGNPPPSGASAPLPSSSSSSPAAAPTRPELLSEVKLYNNNKEREKYDNLADLYAIMLSIEYLERAYIKDSVTPREYAPACEKLIAQCKVARNLVGEDVQSYEAFMGKYKLNCPAALSRLQIGIPATVEHGGMGEGEQKKSAMRVAECVQYFITLMDSLKLNMVAVDEIHPLLNDLMESMNNVSSLSPEFEGKVKVKSWLYQLNQMKASDELSEEQVRQILFDLESAHSAFYRSLQT